jgi:UDP-glucose 4-epimerase
MRILITGGLGFVGGNTYKKLKDNGHHVLVIDNETSNTFKPHRDSVKVDVTEMDNLELVFKSWQPEVVFHFAALVSIYDCNKHRIDAMNINFMGTCNVAELCIKYKVKLVFSETSAVYEGVQLPKSGYVEDKCFPITTYAVSKHAAFLHLRSLYHLHGLEFISLRYFNITGPFIDYKRTVPPLFAGVALRMVAGKKPIIFGDPERSRDFIHINDIVNLHNKIITDIDCVKWGNVYNVGTGQSFSLREIVELIGKRLNKPTDFELFDEINGEALTIYANSSKLLNDLNWRPNHNIDDMVNDTIKYLKEVPDKFLRNFMENINVKNLKI